MELWVTTSDVNLGKLVPLEVHDRLKNAKMGKKNNFGMGHALCRWKDKKSSFPTS